MKTINFGDLDRDVKEFIDIGNYYSDKHKHLTTLQRDNIRNEIIHKLKKLKGKKVEDNATVKDVFENGKISLAGFDIFCRVYLCYRIEIDLAKISKDSLIRVFGTIKKVEIDFFPNKVYIEIRSDTEELNLLQPPKASDKGCFIATAIYSDPQSLEVVILKSFRDKILSKYFLGRQFIKFYYWFSPAIADWIENKEKVKGVTKLLILNPVVNHLIRREKIVKDLMH